MHIKWDSLFYHSTFIFVGIKVTGGTITGGTITSGYGGSKGKQKGLIMVVTSQSK